MNGRFWLNAVKILSAGTQRRFIETFRGYTDAVVQQSADRSQSHVRDITSYFTIRRETIGITTSYAFNELPYHLPDEVFENPLIKTLTELSVDMIIIANDMCSYNVE